MADHFYGLNVGGNIGDVVKATSTTSDTVELRIHDGVTGITKNEVLRLIEVLEAYITTDNAPA